MEGYRVKNIVIVILLIINGFLLVLVGARREEARRYEQSALERTIQVLSENGIETSLQAVSHHTVQHPRTTRRSAALEGQLASALLGETVEGVNRGGGLYTYTTDRGQLSFRAGGELTSALADVPYWQTNDPLGQAETLMNSMKLQCRLLESDLVDGTGRVTYVQLLDGVPLFSCRITFCYENRRLTSLYGDVLVAEETNSEDGDVLSLPTVLMNFLGDVLDSGDVCSAILTVEPGYLLTQSFTDTIRLKPVWYISTNTADYYVDGMTGELSRAE